MKVAICLYNIFLALGWLMLLQRMKKTSESGRQGLFFRWFAFVCFLFFTFILAGLLGGGLFGMLALFSFGVFLHSPVLLVGTALRSQKAYPRTSFLFLSFALLIVLIGVDAFVVEPHWLEINRYQIRSAKIKKALKIVVLADLQTDFLGDYEKDVLKKALAEKADIILFPGDYIQVADSKKRKQLYQELNAYLKSLSFKATKGVFAVEGNVDSSDWPIIFDGLPIKSLTHREQLEYEDFEITGLSLRGSFATRLKIKRKNSSKFHLVLGHCPNFALGPVDADLLVAGHTHGGQVRLPFIGPLITLSAVPRSWAAGLNEIRNGTHLLVARGIGMERLAAPRLRFLCRPEIVILEILPIGK